MTPDRSGSQNCPACLDCSAYWAECIVTVCPMACVEPAMRGTAGLLARYDHEQHRHALMLDDAPRGVETPDPLPSDVAGIVVEFIVWMLVAGVGATVVTWCVWWVRHV